jgi:hypothetical protein
MQGIESGHLLQNKGRTRDRNKMGFFNSAISGKKQKAIAQLPGKAGERSALVAA